LYFRITHTRKFHNAELIPGAKALITNRVRYRGITAGKSNHPRGIPTTCVPAVFSQRLSVLPRCSRGAAVTTVFLLFKDLKGGTRGLKFWRIVCVYRLTDSDKIRHGNPHGGGECL